MELGDSGPGHYKLLLGQKDFGRGRFKRETGVHAEVS
jgi:hypothetical protein